MSIEKFFTGPRHTVNRPAGARLLSCWKISAMSIAKCCLKKLLVATTLFALAGGANAYSECARYVKNIWNDFSSQTFYVTFEDGGSPIKQAESQLSPGEMSRFAAVVMIAQATGRRLSIRYPEDNLTCPPAGPGRSDFTGVWLLSE